MSFFFTENFCFHWEMCSFYLHFFFTLNCAAFSLKCIFFRWKCFFFKWGNVLFLLESAHFSQGNGKFHWEMCHFQSDVQLWPQNVNFHAETWFYPGQTGVGLSNGTLTSDPTPLIRRSVVSLKTCSVSVESPVPSAAGITQDERGSNPLGIVSRLTHVTRHRNASVTTADTQKHHDGVAVIF